MTVLRNSTQVVDVLVKYSPVIRMTQQVILVGYVIVPDEARVTQQFVNVLYTTDAIPETRITKQSINVLFTNTDVPETRITKQSINVLYTVSAGLATQTPSNTLSISQDVDVLVIRNRDVTSELTLTQDATLFNNERVGNTLALTQSASAQLILNQSASNILTLTQEAVASVTGVFEVSASNTIVLTQEAGRVLPVQTASNTLTLTQNVDYARPTESILELTQEATAYIGGIPRSVASVISLTQSATAQIVVYVSASSALTLTQEALRGLVVEGATIVSSTLELTQLAVGTVQTNYVLIQAPFAAPESAVVLPAPLLDDKENNVSNLAVKRSMDGTTRTYVKKSESHLLSYTFDLSRSKGLELQAFLANYNGETMRLQNWRGEIWSVHLMTNPINYTQNRRGPNVGVNLQFEGVKISG